MSMRTSTTAILRIALSASLALGAMTRADPPKYFDGIHTDLDRVRARIDEIKKARADHPEWFSAVEPYLTPVPYEGALGAAYRDGRRLTLRKAGPEVLLPRYKQLIDQFATVVEELRTAAQGAGIVPSSAADEAAARIRQAHDISETDFVRLRELAGWEPLKYDPQLLLAWEESLLIDQSNASWIQRSSSRFPKYTDWTHRYNLLVNIVLSFDDPKSLVVLGEVARYASRSIEHGKVRLDAMLPMRYALERILCTATTDGAMEAADTISLAPTESRPQIEELVGNSIAKVGGNDNGKYAAEWRKMLDELESTDSSWRDRANVLRRAIDVGLQREEEWKRQDEEHRRKMAEQDRRVREQMEQMEKK